MAKAQKKKRLKKPDIKKLILGTASKSDTPPGSIYPEGTQGFVPVSDIKNGVVITKDGRHIKILEVLPVNFYLKSEIEQQNIIYYLGSYMKIAPDNLQILVRTGRTDIDSYCKQMEEFYNRETNENCRNMILENAELVNYLAENEAVTRRFFLIFEYKGMAVDDLQIAQELAEQAEVACNYLDYCGLEVLRHENYDEFLLSILYSIIDKRSCRIMNPKSWQDMMVPVFGTGECPENELNAEDQDGRLTVQDILAPSDCDFTHKTHIVVDNVYHSYLYLSGYGYPTGVSLAWLSPLVELGDGISLNFSLERKRKDAILPKISKTTMINRSRMREVGDTRTDYEELDDAIASGLYIKDEMNRNGEDFYWMHTLIEVTAEDEETLRKRISQVENLCGSLDMTVRRADYKHEQAFISMLPLCKIDPDIERKSRRNVLTHGAAAAFPFSSFELCDDKGVFLGINLHNSSAVILDNFDSDKYSNGSLAIFGMSGAGKTYTMLTMAMRYRLQQVQIMAIVPEKGFEYENACAEIGGQFIRLAAGSQEHINMMEIRRLTLDIDDDIRSGSKRTDSVLLDKIQQLHTYFSLADPDISKEQHHQLDAAILETYRQFDITRENESLIEDGSIKAMPDFTDLLPNVQKNPDLKNVALMLRRLIDMGLGGQTNVRLKSKFIVFDVSKMPKEFNALGMFVATSFVRDALSRSRTTKKVVVMDEGWKIAGQKGNEDAADFVIELVKTIRGLGGIFISATQNIIDYFALQDGKFGDTLLGNSRIKILLQMEEAEALKIKEKLGLSEEETMQIIRSNRGQGLLCAGPNRINIEIRSTQTEYDLITTNRADLEMRRKENENV